MDVNDKTIAPGGDAEWQRRRMVNMPHPHEKGMRVVGFVIPYDEAGPLVPTEILRSILTPAPAVDPASIGPLTVAAAITAELEAAPAERLARPADKTNALRALLTDVVDADGGVRYLREDDEVGERACCRVMEYNPHEPSCYVARAAAMLAAHPPEAGPAAKPNLNGSEFSS